MQACETSWVAPPGGEVGLLETLELPQAGPDDRFRHGALCRHPKVDFAADWERYKDWGG